MFFLKKILVFSLVVLVLTMPTVGYTQKDNTAEWQKAIENTNKMRMRWAKEHPKLAKEQAEAVRKANEPPKTQPIEKKEQICLENGKCVNADFKWGVKAKYLKDACNTYVNNKSNSFNKIEAQKISGCMGYLNGFIGSLQLDRIIRYKETKSIGTFCFNRIKGFTSTASESLAIVFVNFMRQHSEMEDLNTNYVLFQMLKYHKQLCNQQK